MNMTLDVEYLNMKIVLNDGSFADIQDLPAIFSIVDEHGRRDNYLPQKISFTDGRFYVLERYDNDKLVAYYRKKV